MASAVHDPGLKRFGAVPSAAGTVSRHAYAQARAAGIDVDPLMLKAGVTRDQVRDDNVRLTVKGQIKFISLVASALGDEFLGFHLAGSFDLREAGLLYYVPASSGTLGDALQRLERYSTLGNEGVVLRICEKENFAVTFHHIGVERLSDRHQIECFITLLVRLARQMTNRRLLPTSVCLRHRRKGRFAELEDSSVVKFFSAPTRMKLYFQARRSHCPSWTPMRT